MQRKLLFRILLLSLAAVYSCSTRDEKPNILFIMADDMRPDAAGCDYPYSQYFISDLLPEYPSLFTWFHNQGYHLETMGILHHGYLDEAQVNHREFRTHEYYDPVNQTIYNNTFGKRKQRVAKLLPFELADMPDSVYDDARMGSAASEFIINYKKRDGRKIKQIDYQPQTTMTPFTFEDQPADKGAHTYKMVTVDQSGERAENELQVIPALS